MNPKLLSQLHPDLLYHLVVISGKYTKSILWANVTIQFNIAVPIKNEAVSDVSQSVHRTPG